MRCDEARRALFDLAHDADPAGALADHLAACSACRAELAADRTVQARLRGASWPPHPMTPAPQSGIRPSPPGVAWRGIAHRVLPRRAGRAAAAIALLALAVGLAFAMVRAGFSLRLGGEDAYATIERAGRGTEGQRCAGLLGWLLPDQACREAGRPDPEVWARLAPSGDPPPPRGHGSNRAFGYDEANNRLVFHGGSTTGDVLLNDTWVLAGADGTDGAPRWQKLAARNPPPPRRDHAGAYDPVHNRLMIYGGCLGQCTPLDNQVYVLTHANGLGGTPVWSRLAAFGAPPPARDGHAAAYDAGSNRLIVFGGDDCCGQGFNDTWALTHANGLGGAPTWLKLATAGTPPAGRAQHAAQYDAASHRLIVFGGQAAGASMVDIWVLTHATGLGGVPTWLRLSPDRTPRLGTEQPAVAYAAGANRLSVIGGTGEAGAPVEVWDLQGANGLSGSPAWARRTLDRAAPSARCCAMAAYRPSTGVTILVAGEDAAGRMMELWTLGPASAAGQE